MGVTIDNQNFPLLFLWCLQGMILHLFSCLGNGFSFFKVFPYLIFSGIYLFSHL